MIPGFRRWREIGNSDQRAGNYLTDPASDYTDTKYTYYPTGKSATETDPAGNQWSWTYDLLGDQLTASDPDTGTTTDTFDNANQLITSTDARGKQISYVYDGDGRKTAEYDTTSTTAKTSANMVASWVFDTIKKGYQTSSASYSNGDTYTSSTLAYNTMGDPSATKVTLTGTDAALVPAAGYTTTYGYTYSGLPSGQDDPAMGGLPSENIKIGYDEFGQPTGLASTGGATWTYVSAVGYSESGEVSQITMPTVGGGVYATFGYDPQTQGLTSVETTDSTSTNPVDELSYTYGNASGTVSKGSGLLTQVTDSQNGGSTVDTQCFTYDYAQRLSQAWTATDQCAATPAPGDSGTVGGTDAPYWQSWTYGASGNRLTEVDHDTTGNTANDTSVTHGYPAAGSSTDQPNTLSSTSATGPGATAQTATYAYDASGNSTSVTGGALGNQSYTWNDQDQLQSTITSAGTTYYAYDASGTQIIMRDPGSTLLTVGDAQLTLTGSTLTGVRFYTLGSNTIAERTSAGAVSDLVPDRQGTDQVAISIVAAQTVTRRQYLPFGGTRGGPATWVGGDKGYIGGQSDTATSLKTLGARVYDSVDGRFICADSVFEANDPTQVNGYDYAGNDPVTAEDPTGDMPGRGGPPDNSAADQAALAAMSAAAEEEVTPSQGYVYILGQKNRANPAWRSGKEYVPVDPQDDEWGSYSENAYQGLSAFVTPQDALAAANASKTPSSVTVYAVPADYFYQKGGVITYDAGVVPPGDTDPQPTGHVTVSFPNGLDKDSTSTFAQDVRGVAKPVLLPDGQKMTKANYLSDPQSPQQEEEGIDVIGLENASSQVAQEQTAGQTIENDQTNADVGLISGAAANESESVAMEEIEVIEEMLQDE